MNYTLSILLAIEDTIFNWAFTQVPIIATCLALIIISSWITWLTRGWIITFQNKIINGDVSIQNKFNKIEADIQNRAIKTETDVQNKFIKTEAEFENKFIKNEDNLIKALAEFRNSAIKSEAAIQNNFIKIEGKLEEIQNRAIKFEADTQNRFIKVENKLEEIQNRAIRFEADTQNRFIKVENKLEEIQNRAIKFEADTQNNFIKIETGFENKFVKAQSELQNLSVKLDANFSQLNNNQIIFSKTLNATIRETIRIDKKLERLIVHLQATNVIGTDLFNSLSPIQLSETGSKILIEMGGKDYIDTHSDSLILKLEQQGFKSALDVQNYCVLLLHETLTDDTAIPVKNYIYQTPVYKFDKDKRALLNLEVAISIMSIYLRNKYLEKHPELMLN